MAEPHNPYATPQADLLHPVASSDDGPWRDTKFMVVRCLPSGTAPALPHRCVKCNEPGVPGKPKTFSWMSPAFILIIFVPFGLFILIALYLALRKKLTLAPVFCDHHLRRRKLALLIGGIGSALSLAMIVYGGTALESGGMIFGLGWLFLIGSLIATAILNPSFQIARIDKDFARFRGCGAGYLGSLPSVDN